jgi:hypothetical protein
MMFTGSEYILKKCTHLQQQLLDVLSSEIEMNDYGETINLLLVNVIFQDAGMIKPGTNLSRENNDIRVDVSLSLKWAKEAQDSEIVLALYNCLIEAVKITDRRLTRRDDDFDAQSLIADLKAKGDSLSKDMEIFK